MPTKIISLCLSSLLLNPVPAIAFKPKIPLFEEVDIDMDGVLKVHELTVVESVLAELLGVDPERIEVVFDSLDTNSSGDLDVLEYEVLKRYA